MIMWMYTWQFESRYIPDYKLNIFETCKMLQTDEQVI